MKISDKHPDYSAVESVWATMRDTDGGALTVKSRGATYLPKPGGMSSTAYAGYIQRADFFPGVSRTVAGLSGAVCQKDPQVKVPGVAKEWLEDIDASDSTLNQFAGDTLREVMLMGRAALVVDMTEGERPVVVRYKPEDVISWSTTKIKGKVVLSRVVLREEYLDEQLKPATLYRELYLDDKQWATAIEWTKASPREVTDPTGDKYIPGPPTVLTKRGEPLDFLPVVIFGSTTIGPEVQSPPLLELAHACVAFYQVSADLRHSLHFLGCPTIVVSGESLAADGNDESLIVGPSVVWRLAQGATARVLGLEPGSVKPLQDYLQTKKTEMAMLGARLLEEQAAVAETATSVMLRHSGEHATLRSIATVVSQALTTALSWACWWTGSQGKVNVALNSDLFAIKSDPQELQALLSLWQAGAISYSTFYSNLVSGNIARQGVDADEEKSEIEREEPAATPRLDGSLLPTAPGMEPNKAPGAANDNAAAEQEAA